MLFYFICNVYIRNIANQEQRKKYFESLEYNCGKVLKRLTGEVLGRINGKRKFVGTVRLRKENCI